jgi:thiol-disulfide isomerase/thioredoxin
MNICHRKAPVFAARLLAVLCLLVVAAGLPDCRSQEKTPNPRPKPRKVWTEDNIDEVSGGISVVGTVGSSDHQESARPVRPPSPPVPFRAKTIDGEEITTQVVNGRFILVQFWTTWCPVCRRDQPAVDRITENYVDRVFVLAVDSGEKRKIVEDYLKTHPRSCAVALESDTDLSRLSGRGFPHYVLLSPRGDVVGTRTGGIGTSGLRALLAKAGL